MRLPQGPIPHVPRSTPTNFSRAVVIQPPLLMYGTHLHAGCHTYSTLVLHHGQFKFRSLEQPSGARLTPRWPKWIQDHAPRDHDAA